MANLLAQAGKKMSRWAVMVKLANALVKTPQPNIDAPQDDPFANWEAKTVLPTPGYRETENMANMNNKMGQINSYWWMFRTKLGEQLSKRSNNRMTAMMKGRPCW